MADLTLPLQRAPARRGRLAALIAPESTARIKKPNEAITLKMAGKVSMGFLHRKILNVMLKVAQDQRQPGRVLPPFDASKVDLDKLREYFWAPLQEFVRDARFDSNDTRLLRETIEEMQDIKLRLDETDWLSEVLVPSVRISPVGGSVWVGFFFAPETRSLVMRPRQYTEMMLHTQTLLSSGTALALYEICRRYLTNKVPLTVRAPWHDWYYWLSGHPVGRKVPEFKYWKRDTLKRIEVEINQLTDVRIARLEFRRGRNIEDLQYEVHPNEQVKLSFPGTPPIDTEILARLMAVGVSQNDAERLIGLYDEGRLRANLEYTEREIKKGRVHVPRSFLKSALEENYAGQLRTASASVAIRRTRDEAALPQQTLRDRFLRAQDRDALKLLQEVGEGDRARLLDEFVASAPDLIRKQYSKAGMENPLVQQALARFVAEQTWGMPSETDLVTFADRELARAEQRPS